MSQWVKAQCETISDVKMETFQEALKGMGLYADFNVHSVNGYFTSDGSRDVDAALFNADGSPTNIGLTFESDGEGKVKMTVHADWYGKKWKSHADFVKDFTKEYQTVVVCKNLERNYVLEEVENRMDGKRKLVFRRAA
jgi:hypothetical protein